MAGAEQSTQNGESDWIPVGSNDGRKVKECFNCHEAGHLRQDCKNKKRIKCFNCERIGHMQKDCEEPTVVRQKIENTPGWRDTDIARKLVASRATQSSSGMTVLQAYLEVDDGKLWRINRE